jgi:valyl-tRNA synthetase
MEGSAVYLDRADAAVVLSAMAHTCERHAVELLAVAIMRDHVHVLCQSELSGSELLQLLKGNASHQLTKDKLGTESPRWWTRSGSSRSMKSGSDLTAAIDYVKNQSHPLAVWSFDMTDGESVELVESARAEARGSLENPPGIRLGDGSNVKGLAQAAMDAVTDRCIQVFPARYAKSYLDWLGEKRDWCISRQLWWGHRIAVWEARFLGGGGAKSIAEMRSWQRDKIDALQAELDEMAQKLRLRGRYVVRAQRDLPPNVCFICTSVDDAEDALESVSADLARQQQTGRIEYRAHSLRVKALISDLRQDEDVLDTWFSAGLWPFSTLGWPEDTEHLKQYYPTSVLVTSRDIITNWVARMVMFGLYSMGKVPFDRVYITPKVLDGRGETMSKSKGNGVDPVDIIHTYGADALRYSIADLTTETQDIRMPVDYLCPHCGKLTEQMLALKAEGQARKSRGDKLDRKIQPADCHEVRCAQCKESFATQWADDGLKAKLGVGRETSERFEIGRNFANKLWNAARFAFMNLADVPCERIDVGSLPPEDRWILAKLSQTIRGYHAHLSGYEFAASVKDLRDFFWDSLCDWYIELTKPRLVDDAAAENSASAKQVLAFCLDQVLRLWHPTMPFITERLWRELNEIAPNRGLPGIAELESENQLVTAEFPPVDGYLQLDDAELIEVFAGIQDFVRTVRDLRSSCDVPPRERVTITVVASDDQADAFRQYAHIVRRMAGVAELRVDPAATRPKNAASASVGGLRVYVHGISDDAAERTRTEKSLADLDRQITGKRGKLSNEKFVANAKPEVVEAERHRLAELESQASALHAHLAELDS